MHFEMKIVKEWWHQDDGLCINLHNDVSARILRLRWLTSKRFEPVVNNIYSFYYSYNYIVFVQLIDAQQQI